MSGFFKIEHFIFAVFLIQQNSKYYFANLSITSDIF